jgi:hypothetical protein
MKQLFIIAYIAICTTKLYSQCANPENIYTFTYNEKTYEVVKEKKNWVASAACAVERGGHLVEINNVNEQNAIYDAIINGAGVQPNYTQIANGGNIAYVWIGATDQAAEGVWLWDGNNNGEGIHFWSGQGANGTNNGETIGNAYTNWGGTGNGTANEPDNWSGQNHAAIGLQNWPASTGHLGSAGEWNDIIGSSQLYFVIEGSTISSAHVNTPLERLTLYPNPTSGIVKVSIDYCLAEVFDITGILLKQFSSNETIDLSNLAKSTYFIRVTNKVYSETKKVVLQ